MSPISRWLQGIVDYTGTETRQFFFCVYCYEKIVVCPYVKWNTVSSLHASSTPVVPRPGLNNQSRKNKMAKNKKPEKNDAVAKA